MIRSFILAALLSTLPVAAQTATEPTTPAATTFHDHQYGVTFHVPSAWTLTRRDAELSTFALDVRNPSTSTRMRALATITSRSTEQQCRSQATAQAPRTVTTAQIGGATFAHGYDEHGTICTESRDEIYTALRNNACYRFDLILHNFCGGDVSGVRDISPAELTSVRQRLESILTTVTFDSK